MKVRNAPRLHAHRAADRRGDHRHHRRHRDPRARPGAHLGQRGVGDRLAPRDRERAGDVRGQLRRWPLRAGRSTSSAPARSGGSALPQPRPRAGAQRHQERLRRVADRHRGRPAARPPATARPISPRAFTPGPIPVDATTGTRYFFTNTTGTIWQSTSTMGRRQRYRVAVGRHADPIGIRRRRADFSSPPLLMRKLPRGFWPLLALAVATIPVAGVFTLSQHLLRPRPVDRVPLPLPLRPAQLLLRIVSALGSVSGERPAGGQRRALSAVPSPVAADPAAAAGGRRLQRRGSRCRFRSARWGCTCSCAATSRRRPRRSAPSRSRRPARSSRRRIFRTCRGRSPRCRSSSGRSSACSSGRTRARDGAARGDRRRARRSPASR